MQRGASAKVKSEMTSTAAKRECTRRPCRKKQAAGETIGKNGEGSEVDSNSEATILAPAVSVSDQA